MQVLDLEKRIHYVNLINQEPDIDKIYLYAKDPFTAKHQFLINKRERTDLNHLNDSKAFIKYPNDMDDIYIKILKNTIQIKKVKY